jgi:hypothetical protein
MLLPMVGALGHCILSETAHQNPTLCGKDDPSAATLVNVTLDELGPAFSRSGRYEVGYTLNVPLLRLFQAAPGGGWVLDRDAAKRVAATIRQVDRPVLLYLFSTHFGVGGPMEAHLMSEPENLAQTSSGPMKKDKYYDMEIFPWSVARTDNELTHRREQAMRAVLNAVCELPFWQRRKVAGVTVLGEVHQLFPDFEAGMGFSKPYVVTDYSQASVEGFRTYLEKRFHSVQALNQALGSDYDTFAEVSLPSLDIRKDRLTRFQEHLDAYAGGMLPVTGWVHVGGSSAIANWVRVYVNGHLVARVAANLGRQDVLAALPEIGTADVGWRYDLNFADLKVGLYKIDMVLEHGDQPLQHLATRTVGVIDKGQKAPALLPQQQTPNWQAPEANTKYWVDSPQDQMSVYFNPLVPMWNDFRGYQVAHYIRHFGDVVKESCLGSGPVYTHQIVPFTNPGWDESRFAIGQSLAPETGLSLGVSLYGEPVYGHSFLDWKRVRPAKDDWHRLFGLPEPYGITEFHPLKPMNVVELDAALQMHRQNGAQFVSFFLDPRWSGGRIEPGMNLFSLDPDNKQFGSDQLYSAARRLLSQ